MRSTGSGHMGRDQYEEVRSDATHFLRADVV